MVVELCWPETVWTEQANEHRRFDPCLTRQEPVCKGIAYKGETKREINCLHCTIVCPASAAVRSVIMWHALMRTAVEWPSRAQTGGHQLLGQPPPPSVPYN
jgi:hypothetical protein